MTTLISFTGLGELLALPFVQSALVACAVLGLVAGLLAPLIVARGLEGRVPYVVKIHGSALEYVVKRDPQRFLPAAREGLAAARAVLVGSRHSSWRSGIRCRIIRSAVHRTVATVGMPSRS